MKIKQIETFLLNKKYIRLMQLSISFYLLCCLQLMAYNGFSQDKVTLNLTNTSLELVIKQLEKQTPHYFIYNNDEININQKITINVTNKGLTDALNVLFKKTSITFLVKGKHIILSTKLDLRNKVKLAKFTLSGLIKDSETGETLFGANVIIKDKKKGTVTNEYGFYSITLPEGNYKVHFSYVGYASIEKSVNLRVNKKMNIDLKLSSGNLNEVTINSNNKNRSQVKSILTGVSNLKGSDIKKLPSFFGEPDITRALLTQSGVSSVGEGASGFNVRGGNIDQNLILLDEAPLYNSSHLWGLFSAFNADAIKDLKLYKGGIPARFGGRASSVLDIRQKEGNTKDFKGEGGLGLLFSRLTLEGPLKKDKISYLVSGRRSYFDLFFPLIDDLKGNKLYFYDLNTKLSWNINENNKLYASGYFGSDIMKLGFDGESNDDGTESPDAVVDFRWNNATASLRWNHIFSDKLFANTTGVYSKYNYSLLTENDNGGNIGGAEGNFNWTASINNWIVKSDFTLYANPSTKMRFGLSNVLYNFVPAKISSIETINDIELETEKALEIAPYYEIEKHWEKLSLNVGLRFSWFANIGKGNVSTYNSAFPQTINTITGTNHYKKGEIIKSYSGFEPRLSLKYNLSDRKAFKIGYNRMFQYIHLISNTTTALPFDIWKPAGTYLKPLEVNQFSMGYAYDTDSNMYNFSLEGYYKKFKNIVEYKNGADLFINANLETQLLPAKGYSYGIELGAHKTKGKLTGNINYTYSVTKRKTTSSFLSENINGGTYYPSNYDRPHMFNLITNYHLSKKWDINLFFTYQTGRPNTEPTGRLIFDGNPYLTYSDRNKYRISDTHRMDVSFTYTPKGNPKTKWKGSWSYGVYNLYGRMNAFSVYSTFSNDKVLTKQFSLLGAPIPFITYNFKF